MTQEKDNQEETTLGEDLKGVGQIIVGEIENIGGILTGDPITQAEGNFNVDAGTLRWESAESLSESEEEAPAAGEAGTSNQTE
jgi:hypothetical protein